MSSTAEREAWVLAYVLEHGGADALNAELHERFYAKFGGARKQKNWGAQPVRLAMHALQALHRAGKVDRARISLGGNWQPGMPRSVCAYLAPIVKST